MTEKGKHMEKRTFKLDRKNVDVLNDKMDEDKEKVKLIKLL